MGGTVSFLLVAALCVMMIWCVRRSYKKKKAYNINERVHYKAGSDVIFYPNQCYDVITENRRTDTMVYNDYNILTNSATNASKSYKKIR